MTRFMESAMDAQLSSPMGRFGRPYPVQQGGNYGFDVQSGTTFYITIFQNADQTVLNYDLYIVANDEKIQTFQSKELFVFSNNPSSPERLSHAEKHLVFKVSHSDEAPKFLTLETKHITRQY